MGSSFSTPTPSVASSTGTATPTSDTSPGSSGASTPTAQDCVLGSWSDSSQCSVECGGGTKTQTKDILIRDAHGGAVCPPLSNLTQKVGCNQQPCPVNCSWGSWVDFTSCTVPCGGGNKTQIKPITVLDANGGVPCPLLSSRTQIVSCNTQPCSVLNEPVNCSVGPWTDFTPCTVQCGGGNKTQIKPITVQDANGGTPCPDISTRTKIVSCNSDPCPIDCTVGPWTDSSVCTLPCGGGTKSQIAPISLADAYGGKACPTLAERTKTVPCNTNQCPVDCALGPWTDFTPCSQKCDSGSKTQIMPIVIQPDFGGKKCPVLADRMQMVPCNTQACPAFSPEQLVTNLSNVTWSTVQQFNDLKTFITTNSPVVMSPETLKTLALTVINSSFTNACIANASIINACITNMSCTNTCITNACIVNLSCLNASFSVLTVNGSDVVTTKILQTQVQRLMAIELGYSEGTESHIDFHSNGSSLFGFSDYDVRLQCVNGSTTANAMGDLVCHSNNFICNGRMNINNFFTAMGVLTVPNAVFPTTANPGYGCEMYWNNRFPGYGLTELLNKSQLSIVGGFSFLTSNNIIKLPSELMRIQSPNSFINTSFQVSGTLVVGTNAVTSPLLFPTNTNSLSTTRAGCRVMLWDVDGSDNRWLGFGMNFNSLIYNCNSEDKHSFQVFGQEKMSIHKYGITLTDGGINLNGANVINFGSDQSKDGAAGRIGYGTWDVGSLCIVGGGSSPSRKITMWDNVMVDGNLQVNQGLTVNNTTTINANFVAAKGFGTWSGVLQIPTTAFPTDKSGAQGCEMYWNSKYPGFGYTEFLNNGQGGSGGTDTGFSFWSRTTTLAPTELLRLKITNSILFTDLNIPGSKTINFGFDQVKEPNAGRIGYATFDPDSFCIVGAGTGTTRKTTVWDILCVISRMGIQTQNPTCPLDVGSSVTSVAFYTEQGTYAQVYGGSGGNAPMNVWGGKSDTLAARFNGKIACGTCYVAQSDRRIKNNIQNVSNALDTINKLSPKVFKYIDRITKGSNSAYGFIAQDIAPLVPEAIEYTKDAVPNVYQAFPFVQLNEKDQIIVEFKNEFNIGDVLQLQDVSQMVLGTVLQKNNDYVKLKLNTSSITGVNGTIFVYGMYVEDFHNLTHDYLYTINVAATQELSKIVQNLLQRVTQLETQLNTMRTRTNP